ncbi:hypothetical protein L596_000595 [Steinernema carpocapsae]|uniref:Uncharacterized protein n=1 Tax=Steinernema carpocapsae TaxID=34508 RepID=A0A4U8UIX0_STECR|nr:hypothetical protein L596_000595 [Steinernema carpocapsae]
MVANSYGFLNKHISLMLNFIIVAMNKSEFKVRILKSGRESAHGILRGVAHLGLLSSTFCCGRRLAKDAA